MSGSSTPRSSSPRRARGRGRAPGRAVPGPALCRVRPERRRARRGSTRGLRPTSDGRNRRTAIACGSLTVRSRRTAPTRHAAIARTSRPASTSGGGVGSSNSVLKSASSARGNCGILRAGRPHAVAWRWSPCPSVARGVEPNTAGTARRPPRAGSSGSSVAGPVRPWHAGRRCVPHPGRWRAASATGTARPAQPVTSNRDRMVGPPSHSTRVEPEIGQRAAHPGVVDVVLAAHQHVGDARPPRHGGSGSELAQVTTIGRRPREQPRGGVDAQRAGDHGDRQPDGQPPARAGPAGRGSAGP